MSCAPVLEDFPRLDVGDLRKMIGRKRLKAADSVVLHLPAADVPVELARVPANAGTGGMVIYMCCPACGRRASVLRLLPDGLGAVCGVCLRRGGARYASQT